MSKQAFKRMRKILKLEVNREPLPAYAWPGGYQMYYLCNDGACLCPKCVNAEIENIDDSTKRKLRDGWQLEAVDVNYEYNDMVCAHCNEPIPAAYGDN